MTKEECDNCKAPTAHCQDKQFDYLESADCLDYVPREAPRQSYFEQLAIDRADEEWHEKNYAKKQEVRT